MVTAQSERLEALDNEVGQLQRLLTLVAQHIKTGVLAQQVRAFGRHHSASKWSTDGFERSSTCHVCQNHCLIA